MGPSWTVMGLCSGRLGALLGRLGVLLNFLEAVWPMLGRFSAPLGSFRTPGRPTDRVSQHLMKTVRKYVFCCVWGALVGVFFGSCSGVLAIPEAAWGSRGAVWQPFCLIWARFLSPAGTSMRPGRQRKRFAGAPGTPGDPEIRFGWGPSGVFPVSAFYI